jgi:hypothetical protein
MDKGSSPSHEPQPPPDLPNKTKEKDKINGKKTTTQLQESGGYAGICQRPPPKATVFW